MKKIAFFLIILFCVSCSSKENNLFEVRPSIHNMEISSPAEFIQLTKDKNFTDEEIILFFDSLIPDYFNLLEDICYCNDNENLSDNLRNICSIYQVYILLCKNDLKSAEKQIEKLQTAEVVHYQFDKFISFYFWSQKKYEAANWNADFYLFRLNNEKKRTIKRSGSKIKFEIRFWNDSSFKYLRKMLR